MTTLLAKLRTPLEWLQLFRFTARERFDWVTPLAMLALCTIGVSFIYSAQYATQPAMPKELGLAWAGAMLSQNWVKQILYMVAGLVLYVGVSLVHYRFWLSISHWFYIFCVIPLVLVLIPGVGAEAYGAQRWLPLGFVNYQPSETAKIGVLLVVASMLTRSRIGTLRQSLGVLGKLALAVGVPMFLILLQPDLKSAIVLPPMVFSMLYVSKLSTRFFAAALGAFLLVVTLVAWDSYSYVKFMDAHDYSFRTDKGKYEEQSWFPLHDYQRNRIITFVAPDKIDPAGTGVAWNLHQSLISVGSGGLTGKGWTEGTQAQLGYLPRAVAHNDFIASVIAEEEGFLGSLTVLSLFGVVMFNGIRIAGLARDRFGTLLCLGVTVLFAVHVFVNIAMTIGLVPITGIPLPFISYGGSFVLSCCLLQGLVQSVYRFRKDFV
ncbi:MAG TPA: rod shape-determining protein RodA [Opitutaceae bacterium]|nr:rod shape-determining protein RodA [Opitutaceae bacterium]